MKSYILIAGLAASSLLSSTSAHADPGWRCSGSSDCPESLINDMESHITGTWPSPFNIGVTDVPYTCTKRGGTGHLSLPSPTRAPRVTSALHFNWTLTSNLASFLIGGTTAAADLPMSISVSGSNVGSSGWSATADYVFSASASDVMYSDANGVEDTGVSDLGAVTFLSTSGSFWTGSVPINMFLVDGTWDCVFGPPGGVRVAATGVNGVSANYPISALPITDLIANAIRTQFRAAAVYAVTQP